MMHFIAIILAAAIGGFNWRVGILTGKRLPAMNLRKEWWLGYVIRFAFLWTAMEIFTESYATLSWGASVKTFFVKGIPWIIGGWTVLNLVISLIEERDFLPEMMIDDPWIVRGVVLGVLLLVLYGAGWAVRGISLLPTAVSRTTITGIVVVGILLFFRMCIQGLSGMYDNPAE